MSKNIQLNPNNSASTLNIKNTKIKVCMLLWSDLKYDARVQKEALTLAKENYDVTIFTFATHSIPETLKRIKLRHYQPHLQLALNKIKNPSLRFFFKSIVYSPLYLRIIINVISSKFDIYHAHDIFALPALWLAAKIRKKKLIYDAHEVAIAQNISPYKTWVFKLIEKTLCPHVDQVITTTTLRAQLYVQYYNITQPAVLQNRPLYQAAVSDNRLRKLLKLSENDFIVLYQGALQVGRGLRNLIQVAKKLPYIHLVFIGQGDLEETLRNLSANAQNIHFVKAISNHKLLNYTADADIGMQTLRNTCLNHYTTDSNKLFEYIMAGVPVIASDFPEIANIVRTYQVGLLVNPDNVEEIAAAIDTLYSNKTLRLQLKQEAIAAAKTLSWEQQANKLIELYQELTVSS